MSINGGNNNFDMNRKTPPLSKEDKIIGYIILAVALGVVGILVWAALN